MDSSVLNAFVTMASNHVPGFEVRFKDTSLFMKFLGLLVTPFNPEFMTSFATTIGKRVYFPSRDFYVSDPQGSLFVLGHEYVHAWDAKSRWWFKLSYLFPQILAVTPLVLFGVLAGPHVWILAVLFGGYLVAALAGRLHKVLFWVLVGFFLFTTGFLAIWLTGWVSLALGVALLCLGPWPALSPRPSPT